MNDTMFNNSVTIINDDDDEIYWINIVYVINRNISRYGMSFIWLIGNIGLIFNCIIFYQPALRKSPCSIYFIASNVSQFFVFNIALLTRLLLFGYDIKTIYFNRWYCKIRY